MKKEKKSASLTLLFFFFTKGKIIKTALYNHLCLSACGVLRGGSETDHDIVQALIGDICDHKEFP